MTQTHEFTPLQTAVLEAWPINYDNQEDQLADNYSWTDAQELAEESGLTVKQVKGVLSSFAKRGLVSPGDKNPETRNIKQSLTEDGARAVFAVLPQKTPEQLTCKALANALYEQKVDIHAEVAGMIVKLVKGRLWETLMKTPDGTAMARLEPHGEGNDRLLVAETELGSA